MNKKILEIIDKIETDIVNSEATKFERECLLILTEELKMEAKDYTAIKKNEAKDYTAIKKNGWTCVQGKLGILCHRDKRPCESVSLFKNEVLVVDAMACETKKTPTHRTHTHCAFRKIR